MNAKIEAASRALLDARLWPGAWEKANEVEREAALFEARAAILAAEQAEGGVTDAKYKVGDLVDKPSGYGFPGEVRAVLTNKAGERRYVVECTEPAVAGMLHIFNENQLAPRAAYEKTCGEDKGCRITIHLKPRDDGGLRVWSDDINLVLSNADADAVLNDLGPAIKGLTILNPAPDASTPAYPSGDCATVSITATASPSRPKNDGA